MEIESQEPQSAFPVSYKVNGQVFYHTGMSLRDWFAGQAISGAATHEASNNKLAAWAYDLADEMMKERNK